jgi:hypothetical protein
MSKFKLMTPLNDIRAAKPCEKGWYTLLKGMKDFGPNTYFPVTRILDTNGVQDTLWSLRACTPKVVLRRACTRLAIRFAKDALWIFEHECHGDDRPRKAIEAAEQWLKNPPHTRTDEASYEAAKAADCSTHAYISYAAICAAEAAVCAADAAAGYRKSFACAMTAASHVAAAHGMFSYVGYTREAMAARQRQERIIRATLV